MTQEMLAVVMLGVTCMIFSVAITRQAKTILRYKMAEIHREAIAEREESACSLSREYLEVLRDKLGITIKDES